MLVLGPIGFAAHWLLLALAALPILWFLLRAVPPAPLRRRFPGVVLLLGLTDDESQTDKTPWWLLLLRLLAVALVIVAFAEPIANPDDEAPGRGPLLVVVDGSWASARDWTRAQDRLEGRDRGRNIFVRGAQQRPVLFDQSGMLVRTDQRISEGFCLGLNGHHIRCHDHAECAPE